MQVDLIAMGAGGGETLTAEAAASLTGADWLVGAERLLAALPAGCTARRTAATRPAAVRDALLAARQAGAVRAGVVLSGDTGFYSGAAGLLPLLQAAEIPARVLPGVSSVQLLAARLGRPWQTEIYNETERGQDGSSYVVAINPDRKNPGYENTASAATFIE